MYSCEGAGPVAHLLCMNSLGESDCYAQGLFESYRLPYVAGRRNRGRQNAGRRLLI